MTVIHVYFQNNLSDNPKKKQFVESTIAWLLYLPNEKKLWDVTADPKNLVKLNFKLNDNLIYKACDIIQRKKTDNTETSFGNNNIDCKNITVEMGKGEECILKNTTIENVYANIIKNKEIDDSEYLLNSLPQKNKFSEVEKNGLMNIKYTIQKDKIGITFSYDGGITEIDIENVNNNITKRIVYYAD